MGVSLWLIPLPAFLAILLAVTIHESGHLAYLLYRRIPLHRIQLTAYGAEIQLADTFCLSYGRELAAVLSGPAVNLSFALLFAYLGRMLSWEDGFVFAGANLVLGLYNLLPVLPLDGGQAFRIAVSYFCGPYIGDAAAAVVGIAAAAALFLCSLYFFFLFHSGCFFIFAAAGLLIGAISQVGLAKYAVKV